MVDLSALERFLKKHKRIGLDSNILIYFVEGNPRYQNHAKKIFESIETGHNLGVCSTLALLEILVQPYRDKDEELINRFFGLLTTYPHLTWVDLSKDIADLGAQLRAKYNLKTPDAILLATAMQSGTAGFIGNDVQLKRVKELDIFVLA